MSEEIQIVNDYIIEVINWLRGYSNKAFESKNYNDIEIVCQAAENSIALRQEVERLRATLVYYADESNYWRITDSGKCHTACNADAGLRARKALAPQIGEK